MRYLVLRESIEGWFVVGEVVAPQRPDWTEELDAEIGRRPHWIDPHEYAKSFAHTGDVIASADEAHARFPDALRAWRAGDDAVHDNDATRQMEAGVWDDLRWLAERGDEIAAGLLKDGTVQDGARYITLDAEFGFRSEHS